MQRMIIGLVIFLTCAVGALALVVLDLSGRTGTAAARTSAAPARTADGEWERARAAEVAALDKRLTQALGRIDELKRELKRLRDERALDRNRTPSTPLTGPAPIGGGPAPASGADPLAATERPRAADGSFVISPEDEAYFLAVQKRVERTRRIEGMTRNLMRRVERLEQSGELAPIEEHQREALVTALRRYVAAGDDLVTRYVRAPTAEVRAMTADQRRESMATERERFAAEAQRALEQALGQQAGVVVGERVLTSSWGARRKLDRTRIAPRRNG